MKRLAILSIILLLLAVVSKAQPQPTKDQPGNEKKIERKALIELKGNEVNPISMNSFFANFGDSPDVKWKRGINFDVAIFTNNGVELKAYYDFDGNLVGTTSYKTFSDLPAKGQKNIKAQYKDYTIGPVIFFHDNSLNQTDMLLYGIQFESADNYFVALEKRNLKIIVQVDPIGGIYFFKKL